jgi:hypothetical protein
MPSIEIDKSVPYTEAKKMAGALMAQNPLVSSVRILIDKDTHQMRIDYTEFPKETVDKLF